MLNMTNFYRVEEAFQVLSFFHSIALVQKCYSNLMSEWPTEKFVVLTWAQLGHHWHIFTLSFEYNVPRIIRLITYLRSYNYPCRNVRLVYYMAVTNSCRDQRVKLIIASDIQACYCRRCDFSILRDWPSVPLRNLKKNFQSSRRIDLHTSSWEV